MWLYHNRYNYCAVIITVCNPLSGTSRYVIIIRLLESHDPCSRFTLEADVFSGLFLPFYPKWFRRYWLSLTVNKNSNLVFNLTCYANSATRSLCLFYFTYIVHVQLPGVGKA